jgi:hypothetical protein
VRFGAKDGAGGTNRLWHPPKQKQSGCFRSKGFGNVTDVSIHAMGRPLFRRTNRRRVLAAALPGCRPDGMPMRAVKNWLSCSSSLRKCYGRQHVY